VEAEEDDVPHDSRTSETSKFARLPNSHELGAREAGEFLGRVDGSAQPLSPDRIRQFALDGRIRGRKLGTGKAAPWLFRLGDLRRIKPDLDKNRTLGHRPPAREYRFDSLPDSAVIYTALAAAKFVGMHPQHLGRQALLGRDDPGNAKYPHGRKRSEGRGAAWEFTMRELRRYKRVREGGGSPDLN
jgi:hypothetical protein